jgi:dUTPase
MSSKINHGLKEMPIKKEDYIIQMLICKILENLANY